MRYDQTDRIYVLDDDELLEQYLNASARASYEAQLERELDALELANAR